jgi:uncharacterized protein YjiK
MKSHRLSIDTVHDIPLSEVSGLGQRRMPDSLHEVLAVGDQQFDIVVVHTDGDGGWQFETVSLAFALQGARADKSSEWEAADGDATGRVFMLQESPSRVYIADQDFEQIEHVIELKLERPERRELNWDADSNARAEGLVLLNNGHVLVAKEKEPPLILEFGKGHDGAEGMQPDLLLDSLGAYPLPNERTTIFDLLTTWHLDEESEITDISDMAPGPDDRLYLLSDESRCIAQVQTRVSRGESTLSVVDMWKLPDELQQPEGLVIMEGMVPLVAIDRDEQEENLFVLESLA